jgi:hypothetical protein
MNTYFDSDGNGYTTPQIERRITKAGESKLLEQQFEHGFNFCEKCKRNDCNPIDVSHTISRKYAKENSCVEVLWDLENLEILGRDCHQIKDKLNLKFTG